jgi:hypothetical protein
VYGFQILSHLILFFADGFPPISMLLLRWISTIFIQLLRWISTNFYTTTEMNIHQFLYYYWDGYPPIFILLLRWISTNFYTTTEMDIHQFFCYYWDGYPPIFRLLLRWISTNFYASTEMDFHQFCCYYCGVGFDSFQNVLDHTCDFHGNMVLKVKSLELIITTGKFG